MRGVGKGAAKDSLTRILARRDIGMDVFGHCRVSKAAISAICRSRNQPNMRFRCRIPDHRTRRVARIYSP